jgi:hypothetical protein
MAKYLLNISSYSVNESANIFIDTVDIPEYIPDRMDSNASR